MEVTLLLGLQAGTLIPYACLWGFGISFVGTLLWNGR
jgi:hypothetical protein